MPQPLSAALGGALASHVACRPSNRLTEGGRTSHAELTPTPWGRRLLVPLSGTGFNLLVIRPGQVVSALAAAARNDNVRRVQLAWGAAIAAEWAHFVALGVFAYEHGGTSAVGLAGLVRLLPAAAVAPEDARIERLERLTALRERGVLSDEEFASQKAQILA